MPLIFMRNPVGLFISCVEKEVVIKTTQIVDKLDENINWAIPNWYFHFLFA